MATSVPLKSGNTRVFLIEGRAAVDHAPEYYSQMRITGVSRGFGDIERIEVPDPSRYGKFVEAGYVRGETERPTTTLEGRYAQELLSDLLRLARQGCSMDVQMHIGACQDASVFTEFDKILILEDATITEYTTDDLGALGSGDNAVVNEQAPISAADMYEVVGVAFGVKATNVVTNEVVDVVLCDAVECGECANPSDGCYRVYAVTKSAGGSPSTPPDVVFSIDRGQTWYAHDIESLGIAEDPSAIDCIGLYLVVVSNASGSHHYALKSEHDGITDPVWTEATTGYVVGGEPNDIFGVDNMCFIVGDQGYIYKLTDPTSGVEVVDAGSATDLTLRRVHAISDEVAVAVGDNGAVVYTLNGTSWAAAPSSPVGIGVNLTCVCVKSTTEWLVGTDTGYLYYTTNGGVTWTEKGFPGCHSGAVHDIGFSTPSVGWLSHSTSTPAGRILRSYDGGYQWVIVPEGESTLSANDRVNRLAGCREDPNYVVGVGLADDAADGFVVVGGAAA